MSGLSSVAAEITTMNKIIALVLIIAGVALIYTGVQRKDSFAGTSERVGKQIAAKVDGDPHVTNATVYIVGGSVAALIGVGMMFRRG